MATLFVGRVAELHQLEANLRAARAGEFRLVLLAGEAGIGKTRLLNEFLERTSDVGILAGSCLPLESAPLPYGPIVDGLHGFAHAVPPSELEDLLGPARLELARLVPELATGDAPAPQPIGSEREARARLFEHLLGFLERAAARQALVIGIEDVHWADTETRDVLRFLVRGLRRSPVLVVVTVRTDDAQRPARASFAAELARLGSAVRVEIRRFDEDEVGLLAAELLGRRPTTALARRLADRSDGIPFVVEQLVQVREADEALPPTLAEMIQARLTVLSAAARTVLRIAAACGRRVDEPLLVEVSSMKPERVDHALAEAVRAGILAPVSVAGETRYEFRHELLREAIDLELPLSDRKRIHRTAAASLEARASSGEQPESAGLASELAHHWEAAEEWSRALAAHLDAATAAEHVYGWGAALVHCERALAIADRLPTALAAVGVDRPEVLHRLAEAAYHAADYDAAIARGREAIRLTADDPARAGAYHERLRRYLWDAGDRKGAMASVEEALRLIPPHPPSRALASVLGQFAAVQMHSGRPDQAVATAERALAVARATDSIADVGQALGIIGWIQVVRGEVDHGLATMEEALAAATAAQDLGGIALGSTLIAQMQWWLGREAAARDAALAGYERVGALGLQHAYGGILLGHAARALIGLGDWEAADDCVARALEHERVGRPAHHEGAKAAGAEMPGLAYATRRPLRRGVDTMADRVERTSRPIGRSAWPRINRARLLIVRGAWPEAIEDLLDARAFESVHGPTEYGVDLLAAEAELAAWRGDVTAARSAAEELSGLPPTMPFGPAHARAVASMLMAEADEAERARKVANVARESEAVERAGRLLALARGAIAAGSHLVASASWAALSGLMDAEAARAVGTASAHAWAAQEAAWEQAGHPFEAAYARYRRGSLLLARPSHRTEGRALLEKARSVAAALGARPLEERIVGPSRNVGSASVGAEAIGVPDAAIGEEISRVTVHVLGRMRVERDGEPIRHLGGPKAGRRQAEAIFAFLLDRGVRGVTKDEVIELIWDEMDLGAADQAFHRTLGGLRRTLQPDAAGPGSAIDFDHDRYRLDPSIVTWTDVMAFDAAVDEADASADPIDKAMALEEARRLYRGEYFDDCPYFGDSAEVEPTRRRLRARYVEVLVMLGELAEERGDARSAGSLYREAMSTAEEPPAAAIDGITRLGRLDRQLRVVNA